MNKVVTPKETFKAKVRRAHKVYTNEDGVQMCEMEFRKYLVMEQALTELEELKRDVKRYFELYEQAREKWGNGLDEVEAYEYTKLHIKLSKVGKKE